MKPIYNFFDKIKEFIYFKKPTKKEILIFSAIASFATSLGIFIGMCVTGEFRHFKEYIPKKPLSMTDSLSIDTIIKREDEIYADTILDYHKLLKKEIEFKTSDAFYLEGSLSVKNKEFSKYKFLKNGIPSEEIFGYSGEVKVYSLIENFFGRGFKINKLELTKYGTSDFLKDSFEINLSNQKDTFREVYTRGTDLENKILDNEHEKVKRYLKEIAEHNKNLKD